MRGMTFCKDASVQSSPFTSSIPLMLSCDDSCLVSLSCVPMLGSEAVEEHQQWTFCNTLWHPKRKPSVHFRLIQTPKRLLFKCKVIEFNNNSKPVTNLSPIIIEKKCQLLFDPGNQAKPQKWKPSNWMLYKTSGKSVEKRYKIDVNIFLHKSLNLSNCHLL